MTRTNFMLLVLASCSWASGYDNSDHATGIANATSISYSGSNSCPAGDTLFVFGGIWANVATPPTLNTPAMSGQAFTLVGAQTNLVSSSSSSRTTAWYTTNIPTGSPAISMTASASGYLDLAWECFSGYNTLDQQNSRGLNGSPTSISSNTITTSHPAEYIVTWWLNQSNVNLWSINTGTLRFAYSGPANTIGLGDITETSTVTNFSITWSGAAANSIAGIASFYGAATASGTMPPTIQEEE